MKTSICISIVEDLKSNDIDMILKKERFCTAPHIVIQKVSSLFKIGVNATYNIHINYKKTGCINAINYELINGRLLN